MKSAFILAAAVLLAHSACAADGVASVTSPRPAAPAASAPVQASLAWARATVPAQTSSGAFLSLRATQDMRLLSARSSAAERVELHQMVMTGDRMQMGEIDGVDLPAGQVVPLDGGKHFMLMGLKRQLRAGERIDLTLVLQPKGSKRREQVTVQVTVQPLNYAPPKSSAPTGH